MKSLKKLSVILVLFIFVFASFGFSAGKAPVSKKGRKAVQVKKQTGVVNINTAGISELVTLPRIGKKIAQRIIDFRKKNGRFKRIEDLMKVKGIGEKTFNRIKKRLKV